MINVLEYPIFILNNFDEYIKLSKFYINYKTNSIPVRYYNINLEKSTYDEISLTTFDKFKSQVNGIIYDVYEFTPVFYTSPVINMTTNEQDKDFSRFSSILNIQTFTISKVRIGDLIQFYAPDKANTLYRVTNFRVPLNTVEKIPIYELDLEPAPIDYKEVNGILYASVQIDKVYIYDYSAEKYIPLDMFTKKNIYVRVLETQIKAFLQKKLTSDELFTLTYSDKTIVPYELNMHLYNKIALKNYKFNQINLPIPFGMLNTNNFNNNYMFDYLRFNNSGGLLTDILTNTTINISPVNINFDNFEFVNFTNYNYTNYSDIENYLIACYILDKI